MSDAPVRPEKLVPDGLTPDDVEVLRRVYLLVQTAARDRQGERRLSDTAQMQICLRLVGDMNIPSLAPLRSILLAHTDDMADVEKGLAPYGAALREAITPSLAAQSRVLFELTRRMARPELMSAWTHIDDPSAVADRMLATVPRHHPADSKIGPFYDLTGVAKWRGLTRQGVHSQVKRRDLLGLRTKDNVWLFPAFQFDVKGESLPRLREVLLALDPADQHPDGSALWLNTKAKALDGKTPAEVLRTKRAQDAVDIARRIGAAQAT